MTSYIRPESMVQPQAPATAARGLRADGASSAQSGTRAADELSKLEHAAKEFEAVFLRQMLSALEKTTKVGDKGPNVAGQQTYGSMIVDAVADAVASAGGIGLGSVLTKTLATKLPGQTSPSGNSAEGLRPRGEAARPIVSGVPAASKGGSAFEENSPQGFASHAVPRTEIRATASRQTGQQADRRIR